MFKKYSKKNSLSKKNKEIFFALKNRKELFEEFLNDQIKHSIVYNNETLKQTVSIYDVFICGSDQIWNQNGKDLAYFLDFVPDDMLKISYAASLGKNSLSKKQRAFMIPKIKRLDFISVREKDAKDLLQKDIKKEIKVVLDPTFLLSETDWNEVAKCSFNNEPYLFVYLLGNNKKQREQIKKYSKLLGYRTFFLPYVHFEYQPGDEKFLELNLYNIGPAEFIGLIKKAEMVITDSFHGCAFSIIYNKKFWALERDKDTKKVNMNTRLYSLFRSLGLKSRLLSKSCNLSKEELVAEIDYDSVNKKLEALKEESQKFLEEV